ncbi:hypothetical protein Prum_061470 [Phytohabitans rumicis]|uniref:Uncharacterized protein n=1 Tax=Phytohabitans rumicis TaxID=1076125 RepID=A0A6V8LIP3_9ACTN|nr:hypothetical protein Prum_061470 [Phytohabitans rumicis]
MHAVGELDDQYSHVLAGRDDHFADRLGLGRLAVERLVELGDPVDQVGHLRPEVAVERLQRVRRVLDGVVQQRGDQGDGVHAQLGADLRHRERVRDVRLATLAELAPVHVFGDRVAAAQDTRVGVRMDGTMGPGQRRHRVVVGR